MKAKRPRTVFGRVRIRLDGSEYFFAQKRDGLYVRQRYARRAKRVSFADLHALAFGQAVFKL